MVNYNITAIQETTDISSLFTVANDYTGQLLFGMFILAISIVMLMVFIRKGYEFPESLISTAFVGFIISGFAAWANYVNIMIPLAYLAITAFTLVFLFTRS